jgi:hypothetical protein
MKLSDAAMTYYGRIFMQRMMRAKGEDAPYLISEVYVDSRLERMVSNAGTDLGLQIRKQALEALEKGML